MYNLYKTFPCHYCFNAPRYNPDIMYNAWNAYPYPYYINMQRNNPDFYNEYIPFTDEMEFDPRFDFWQSENYDEFIQLKDYGPEPFVVNIDEATKENNTYRTALWTGKHLQVTLMSINVGEDIGLEIHPDVDQFIRIEEGEGLVQMGDTKYALNYQEKVYDDFAIMIPAGKWHNLINTGNIPLKLYSIYAPPEHPHGTVHETKADAEAAEENHGY